MARKFLYFIAVCIVLFIVGSIALTIWSREATHSIPTERRMRARRRRWSTTLP